MGKRKILSLILVLQLSVLIGCTNATTDIGSLETENNNLKDQLQDASKKIDSLEQKVVELQRERDAALSEKLELELLIGELLEERRLEENDVTVAVIDKVNTPKNTDKWIFSSYSTFHFSITNHTEKDIKGIQGVLDIQDMFGETILRVKCDLTSDVVKAGETVMNKDLSLEINEFINDDVKVYNTEYENLIFIYDINQILFTDGTLKKNE